MPIVMGVCVCVKHKDCVGETMFLPQSHDGKHRNECNMFLTCDRQSGGLSQGLDLIVRLQSYCRSGKGGPGLRCHRLFFL